MKTYEHRSAQPRQGRFEADLKAAAAAIFRRCPTLCGFAIRDARGLFVTEISVFPLTGLEAPAEIRSEILAGLAALIDECPEACDLLGNRTFARVIH